MKTLIAIIAALLTIIIVGVLVQRRLKAMGVYVYPRTRFGMALVFEVEGVDGRPVRMLNVGGGYQSASYLDDEYCELAVPYDALYDRVFDCGLDVRRTLMLGGGGYAYPKYLIAHHPEASIDVVEIDPKIEAIARRHFYLDRLIEEYDLDGSERLGLYIADARAYLEEYAAEVAAGTQKPYDAMFGDCFAGKTLDESMVSLESFALAKACLVNEGVFMTNVVASSTDAQGRLDAITASLSQLFAHVYVLECETPLEAESDIDNYIVVATDGSWGFATIQ